MRISDILAEHQAASRPTFSCEFFPPKTPDGETVLWQTIDALAPYSLDFVSVTYGAGGSTQTTSTRINREMIAEKKLTTLAHLTCVGASAVELEAVVDELAAAGVENILALRGDPVTGPGSAWVTTPGGYTYSVELVRALAARQSFSIGVAAWPERHPESKSLEQDAEVLAMKQQAGAHFAITNLFFRADKYFELVELAAKHGSTLPIIPGLMPVTNFAQIDRFTEKLGAELPAELRQKFAAVAEDADAVRDLGVEVATELSRELLAGGAPGIHLYTLNRSDSSRRVLDNLR